MWNLEAGDRRALERLLEPHSIEDFARNYYERAPLHIVRDQPGYYDEFFSSAEMERALLDAEIPATYLKVFNQGVPARPQKYLKNSLVGPKDTAPREVIDGDRISSLIAHGCSVGYDSVQNFSPPMARLVRALETILRHRVNANVYLTPPNNQGFLRHFDTHDTVILQIDGSKHWSVYDSPVELPLKGNSLDKKTHHVGDPQHVEMRPGDLLYLPRGVVHEARSSDVFSLHVTLGLDPILVIDVVRSALTAAGADELALRRSLSSNRAPQFDDSELTAAIERAFAPGNLLTALQRLEDAFVAERRNGLENQLRQLQILPALQSHSKVLIREHMLYRLTSENGAVRLAFSGKTLTLPSGTAAVIAALERASPVAVAELVEGDAGAFDIVRRLIQEGFVRQLESNGATHLATVAEAATL